MGASGVLSLSSTDSGEATLPVPRGPLEGTAESATSLAVTRVGPEHSTLEAGTRAPTLPHRSSLRRG